MNSLRITVWLVRYALLRHPTDLLGEIERSHPVYEKTVPLLLEEAFSDNAPKTYLNQGEVHDWLTALLA